MVGTFVGFVIFLTLLLFSAQLLIRLYAASTLSAAATRAAEQAAYSPDPAAATAPAEAEARAQLGSFGADHTTFTWLEADGDLVALEVTGRSPGFLPLPASWTSISRTVRVRTERFR